MLLHQKVNDFAFFISNFVFTLISSLFKLVLFLAPFFRNQNIRRPSLKNSQREIQSYVNIIYWKFPSPIHWQSGKNFIIAETQKKISHLTRTKPNLMAMCYKLINIQIYSSRKQGIYSFYAVIALLCTMILRMGSRTKNLNRFV